MSSVATPNISSPVEEHVQVRKTSPDPVPQIDLRLLSFSLANVLIAEFLLSNSLLVAHEVGIRTWLLPVYSVLLFVVFASVFLVPYFQHKQQRILLGSQLLAGASLSTWAFVEMWSGGTAGPLFYSFLCSASLAIFFNLSSRSFWSKRSPGNWVSMCNPQGVGSTIPVRATSVRAGDVLQLSESDIVPADAVIVSGAVHVRECGVEGLKHVRLRAIGDSLFAGSRILCGSARVELVVNFGESGKDLFLDWQQEAVASATRQQNWFSLPLLILGCILVAFLSPLSLSHSLLLISGIALVFCLFHYCEEFLARTRVSKAFALLDRGVLVRNLDCLSWLPRCAQLLFWGDDSGRGMNQHVISVDTVDERFEISELMNVGFSILSQSSNPLHASIANELYSSPNREILIVQDFCDYQELGVTALVQESPITVGTEELLVQRGVNLSTVESMRTDDSQLVYYIAVGFDVVCKLILERVPRTSLTSTAKHRRLQYLCSGELPTLRPILHAFGFEQENVIEKCNQAVLERRCHEAGDTIAFLDSTDEEPEAGAHCRVKLSFFDTLRFEVGKSDIVLLDRNLERLEDVFACSELLRTSKSLCYCGLFLLALAVLLSSVFAPVLIPLCGVIAIGVIANIAQLGVFTSS